MALTVSAQQSRFHNEAIEGSARKELIIKDLSIAIGQREILNRAHLQLQVGMHYVLVGRNGTGKSTLLRAIADDHIPSIPQNVRVLLLGQTDPTLEAEVDKLSVSSVTVLQHVLRSDKEREALLREEALLSSAVDANDPMAAVRAYRLVSHERVETRTASARKLVLRRSGARGATAKKELLKLEEEQRLSQSRLDCGEVDATEMASEMAGAADLLADVQARLDAMGAAEAEARARSLLLGLGFTLESIDQPVAHLSGGWTTRCSLACALFQPSDLLLLDEPTNYLDLPSIIWLERHIQNLTDSTTVIVVTHDRSFADNVGHELLVLRNQVIERFKGNLSTYELERVKTWKYRTRMQDAQERQKKHIEATISANVRAAKRAGDDKKLKQAASRRKKLDERMGIEVSAKGGRFKLNRDLVGYHTSKRAEIDEPDFDPPVRLILPSDPADLRFPGALLALEHVSFAYGKGRARKEVLKDVSLTIHMGERVGIAGLNGSGKSTLVSLALAASDDLSRRPTTGSVARHPRARLGIFSQRAVDELDALGQSEPSLTALSYTMRHNSSSSSDPSDAPAERDARALLSGLGLAGRTASDVPLALLSGGQKVRVALAAALRAPPPHLLVLDEVTTHLDADSIEGLVRALRRYAGALLVVSHDRFFMRCVVEGQRIGDFVRAARPDVGDDGPDESESGDSEDDGDAPQRQGVVYRLTKGKLVKLDGGMEQYEEIAARASSKLGKV